jgi:hypothetical protein
MSLREPIIRLARPDEATVIIDTELYNPVALFPDEDLLHVLDRSGFIRVMTHAGHPVARIDLEGGLREHVYGNDLLRLGDRYYVVYDKGPTLLRGFDEAGNLVDAVAKPDERFPDAVLESYNLEIHPQRGTLLIHSRLDGHLFELSPEPGAEERILFDFLQGFAELDRIIMKISEQKKDAPWDEMTRVHLYYPMVIDGGGSIHLIASKPNRDNLHYSRVIPPDGTIMPRPTPTLDFKAFRQKITAMTGFDNGILALGSKGNLFFARSPK